MVTMLSFKKLLFFSFLIFFQNQLSFTNKGSSEGNYVDNKTTWS